MKKCGALLLVLVFASQGLAVTGANRRALQIVNADPYENDGASEPVYSSEYFDFLTFALQHWPENYGWRVAAMGGAALAVIDGTTELNPFNFQNPAGIALLPKENRLDVTSAARYPYYDNIKVMPMLPDGEYQGALYWFADHWVAQMDTGDLRVAGEILPHWMVGAHASSTYYDIVNLETTDGGISVGTAVTFNDLIETEDNLVFGISWGKDTDVFFSPFEENIKNSKKLMGELIWSWAGWKIGGGVNYNSFDIRVQDEWRNYYNEVDIHFENLNENIFVHKVSPFGDGHALILGLEFDTLGSGWITTKYNAHDIYGFGFNPTTDEKQVCEVMGGLGAQLWDQTLSLAMQAGYAQWVWNYDNTYINSQVQLRTGIEWNVNRLLALRMGYQFIDFIHGRCAEQIGDLGIGLNFTKVYSLNFLFNYDDHSEVLDGRFDSYERKIGMVVNSKFTF